MGVGLRVVAWLREQGHDVVHLCEENHQRSPDAEVFAKAADERRILLAFDLDFGEIAAFTRERPASVVLFRLHNTRASHVAERLSLALERSAGTLERGALVVVEESRFRIRELPFRSPEPE
jgi:predicted nuclease of predicted toxin-antitoxin system